VDSHGNAQVLSPKERYAADHIAHAAELRNKLMHRGQHSASAYPGLSGHGPGLHAMAASLVAHEHKIKRRRGREHPPGWVPERHENIGVKPWDIYEGGCEPGARDGECRDGLMVCSEFRWRVSESVINLETRRRKMVDNPTQEVEALNSEIQVTFEMIEAGADALSENYFNLVDSYGYPEIARIVFEAMAAKIEKSHPAVRRTA
jgi:hypothetical protein